MNKKNNIDDPLSNSHLNAIINTNPKANNTAPKTKTPKGKAVKPKSSKPKASMTAKTNTTNTKASVNTAIPEGCSPDVTDSKMQESDNNICLRNADGTFAKGHKRIGGIVKGQHQLFSQKVQTAVLNCVANEVETDRFQQGLQELYNEDQKGYYQVLAALMKFCAPTLQSTSLELRDVDKKKTIDDRLDELMSQMND